MSDFSSTLHSIRHMQLPDGGFPYQTEEGPRPDSTAWAIFSLSAFQVHDESCARGRAHLVSQQAEDGRVSISPKHVEACWPTALAILAWNGFPDHKIAQTRAIEFLLTFKGHHFPNPTPLTTGHDTSLIGWPWVADTHSWVLPTALAMMALQTVGLGAHPRVAQGQHMLLDRQLKQGGWNYGNTMVFGKALHPLPECTGIALQALAGTLPIKEVERSLDYLVQELPGIKTPISLGWILLGLGAWGLKPSNAADLALQSLHLQERYGPYSLPSLALLLCSVQATHGLHSLWLPNTGEKARTG